MKRSLSLAPHRELALTVAGTCLIAGTYGLVRLAYGLFLPEIRASVAMSATTAGYVSSGASAAYCLGALVGLAAAGRPRLLVGAAMATAGVGAVGMACAPGPGLLAASTVLASVGAGLASPGMVAVVARTVAPSRMDRAQATVNSGTGPGLVAAGLLALLVPDWRLGFAISAGCTAAAGIAVLLLDRSDRPQTAGRTEHPATPRWLAALLRPAAGALLLGIASAAVWTYGRTHLVAAGAGDAGSVVAWIALGVGGTATALTARPMSSLRPPRAWMLTTGTTGAAIVALAATALLPGAAAGTEWAVLAWAVVICAAFGWGFVAATSALIAWTGLLVPGRAAAGTALTFVALVLGQAAGSAGVGVLEGPVGLPAAFVAAAVVTAPAAAMGWHSGGGPWCGSRPQGPSGREPAPCGTLVP